MNYSDLFQFQPLEPAIRLRTAEDGDEAGRLVSNYLISDEMADRLTNAILPNLRFEQAGESKGLLIVGRQGTGKSHLMAVVSALAEHKVLGKSLAHAGVASAAAAIAGQFKVLRFEAGGGATDLRNSVCRQLSTSLAQWGIHYTFPARGKVLHHRVHLEEMMTEFRKAFPEQGLLVVLDQLTEYVRGRKGKGLAQDLSFLQELGSSCGSLKFRLITELQEEIFDLPTFAKVAHSFRKAHSYFVQIPIPKADARDIVQHRLVKKTPAQQAKVREHLAQFAALFGDMGKRLEEFVALFPVHPDYFKVVGQIGFVEPGNLVQTLSAAVKKLADEVVPQDRPGLIAYDSYWEQLRNNPANRSIPEFQAVLDGCKRLENKAAEIFKEADYRSMAVRMVHALAIQRLTTRSIYQDSGATPSELCEGLCLYEPSAKGLGGTPADDLLSQVVGVFSKLHESVDGRSLAVNPYNFQCYLRFNRFKRFSGPELAIHWVNALPFLLLLLTGGAMVISRFLVMEPQTFHMVVWLHKTCALLWVSFVPLTTLLRWKVHWVDLRVMLTWGKEDLFWMLESMRSLRMKDAPLTPAGRFNTGQKINACLVIVYFFSFSITGVLMLLKGSMLFPWYLHTALYFSAMASVGGHLYLALINPSTRIALGGIFHGWSPMKYVEHHHPLSLPEDLRTHVHPPRFKRLRDELLVTRTELIAVSVAFSLAGVTLALSYHWQITAIKRSFTKSFSDLINPSELTTKHRIGPTAESCTKCHSFTGQIPSRNCEQCHADVKERRASQIGYHGTLKGECIRCHKEHPTRFPVFVPFYKDKFDHNLATFKREGKHAQVACDDCHKKLRTADTPGVYFIGLKHDTCTDCHQDRHGGQFKAACETCHSVKGWTGPELKFSHATNSAFKLIGKHASLECVKCHKPQSPQKSLSSAVFKGLPHECKDCHQDPHRQQFSAACTTCHSASSWKKEQQTFDHSKDTKFPLVDKHVPVACEKCHQPRPPELNLASAQFRNLKTECADCHKDPHRNQFERACTKCHRTPVAWEVARLQFKHNQETKYPLIGKHEAVVCLKCHKPEAAGGALASANFKGLATACEACHKVKHPPDYGNSCTACHTFAGWPKQAPGFGHIFNITIAGDNLIGKHLTAKCNACHDGAKVGALGTPNPAKYDCKTCHLKDDPHKNALGDDCAKCHRSEGWKGEALRFSHDMASFSLDGDHRKLDCTLCHKNSIWKPLDSKCESCHSKSFLEKRR